MHFEISLFIISLVLGNSIGTTLRCYSCSFSSVDIDHSCLTVSDSTPTVECPYRFCTIRRIEFLDPPGVVSSFRRGCDERPDFLNHDVTDSIFRTFYRACTTSHCNTGNGVKPVGGQGLSPTPPSSSGKNLLVPGTGSGGRIQAPMIPIFYIISVLCLLHL